MRIANSWPMRLSLLAVLFASQFAIAAAPCGGRFSRLLQFLGPSVDTLREHTRKPEHELSEQIFLRTLPSLAIYGAGWLAYHEFLRPLREESHIYNYLTSHSSNAFWLIPMAAALTRVATFFSEGAFRHTHLVRLASVLAMAAFNVQHEIWAKTYFSQPSVDIPDIAVGLIGLGAYWVFDTAVESNVRQRLLTKASSPPEPDRFQAGEMVIPADLFKR